MQSLMLIRMAHAQRMHTTRFALTCCTPRAVPAGPGGMAVELCAPGMPLPIIAIMGCMPPNGGAGMKGGGQ
eukprot:1157037-Pelagomonas_calceolata.AAC.7